VNRITYPKKRKVFRPRTKYERLSDKEIRENLKKVKALYVLGINSEFARQTHDAVRARFGKCPMVIVGEPPQSPALCVKVTPPCRPGRTTDMRMAFSMA
jgi:hypothetical protein